MASYEEMHGYVPGHSDAHGAPLRDPFQSGNPAPGSSAPHSSETASPTQEPAELPRPQPSMAISSILNKYSAPSDGNDGSDIPSSPGYYIDESGDSEVRYPHTAPSPLPYQRYSGGITPQLSTPRHPSDIGASPMRPQMLSRQWDNDMSAEENMAIWKTDLSVYYDKRGVHHALIEQAWREYTRASQHETTQTLWDAYEQRYLGVQERIAADGGQESDNIDMELLDTLTDRRVRRRRDSSSSEELIQDAAPSEELQVADNKYTEPQPELIDPETGAVRAPIPIGERRAAMLDEAHKRVWSIIARRDVPRVYRMVQASAANRAMYWRRLSSVVQREAKRGAARNNKSAKDMQLRARKVMRELLLYWKRNEREERDLRKKAEKEALEKAKKEEEMREAKRQARKLNFLITQTELYSHFVGSKLKTTEAEESEETSGAGGVPEAPPAAPQPQLPPQRNDAALEDIDFDDDDESNLQAHAARNATEAVQAARDKAHAFDNAVADERRNQQQAGESFSGDDLDFLNPSSMGVTEVQQPKMLTCPLKPYQLKGLSWLANLYEQGINGILADEMGLGKTVQSIALMAYLAEVHNIWGPFLVIAPASTLHNWQQEITRFVPALKALPYWGNVKDRAVLRKFWNRKQISYDRDAPFHVLVTSYQLVVTDEKYFQRVKWQYMVLDEAQAIKSSSSNRWKTLLSFNCRNRLLLTGTPVQNSMQELWALLHFIMPSLFDSHDEFSEWFSKDIESHAENKGTLNEHQLRRLHMILKPFMLRRIKKNVQNELGDKIEVDLYTDLSARQKMLYKGLRSHVSIAELMDKVHASDESGLKSLMNLVMQFRKVCNHPELFERADVQAPFVCGTFAESPPIIRDHEMLTCPDSSRSLLDMSLPRSFVRDGLLLDVPGENSRAGFDTRYLDGLLNIWHAPHIAKSTEDRGAFSFLPLLELAPRDAERAFWGGIAQLCETAAAENERVHTAPLLYDNDFALSAVRARGDVRRPVPCALDRPAPGLPPLGRIAEYAMDDRFVDNKLRAVIPSAVAPVPRLDADFQPHVQRMSRFERDLDVSGALYGLPGDDAEDVDTLRALHTRVPHVPPRGIVSQSQSMTLWKSPMQVPQMDKLIVDSSKMARLDTLLRELKAGGHRVLIYFQMTKMIDLMEEYLIYRQYKYLRLDGASKISDRRDMVTDWQTRPELFVFLLSTRAGGLGINLTAADTVIFYDHDWNPSNDSQAMDRAHRLGQTKQVTVYRLITKGTIDERIVKLARNKKEVQDIVVGNKAYSETGMAKPQEIVSLLLDDDELAESMLRRKQADEAHIAQGKSENARAMHARRRQKAAANEGSSNGAPDANWALEDDEDDFFGAQPQREEEEAPEEPQNTKKRRAQSSDAPRRPRKSRTKEADVE